MHYKIIKSININLQFAEDMWIELGTKSGPIVVGVTYRHPTTLAEDYENFSTNLGQIFQQLIDKKYPFFSLGDYNIDLMKIKTNNSVRKYVNSMLSLPCKCAIDLPTRVTDHSKTLIDHIYFNDVSNPRISGVIISDLSDHFGTFIATSSKKIITKTSKNAYIRDMRNFDLEVFLNELSANLNEVNPINNETVNKQFDNLYDIFSKTVCKHAPLRKASRNEKRLQTKP